MATSVRANWHVGDLDLSDDTDPLREIEQLKSEAPVIDLSKGVAELSAELVETIEREAAYWRSARDDDGERPLGCSLKWSPQHFLMDEEQGLSCFNCPHHVADPRSARSLICALGRKQHELVEMIRSYAVAETLDDELVAAFAADIEAGAELAEMALA